MKCTSVHTKLAGYLDDALTGGAAEAAVAERVQVREHLEGCGPCREELQNFRKLGVLLSRAPRAVPPRDLAIRIKVAAARRQQSPGFARRLRDRSEILLDNVLRPLTLPATGGLLTAMVVFLLVFQMIAPGLAGRPVQDDVPTNLMRPAELVALSEFPQSWGSGQHDVEMALPHGLLVDVTVDQRGQMAGYQILAGPSGVDLRHQLDQMLLFSRFSPMLSFGRPTAGGHVILSFSAVQVRG